MQRDTSMPRSKARWVRNVAVLAVVFGMFAVAPVTAWAKNGDGGGNPQQGGRPPGNQGEQQQGSGDNNTGDNSTGGNGGTKASVPEVPYAAALPIVIIGMTVFVYRRRTKSA